MTPRITFNTRTFTSALIGTTTTSAVAKLLTIAQLFPKTADLNETSMSVRLQAIESDRVSDRILFKCKADLFFQPLYLCDKIPLQNDEG